MKINGIDNAHKEKFIGGINKVIGGINKVNSTIILYVKEPDKYVQKF